MSQRERATVDNWRMRELAGEAWRNLGLRHLFWGLALVLVCVGLTLAHAQVATRTLRLQAQANQRGGQVVTIAIPSDASPFPAALCEGLTRFDSVRAAGALIADPAPELYAYPGGPPVPVVRVTSGLVRVFAPGLTPGLTRVGVDLAALGRSGVGTWLLDAQGRPQVHVDANLPDVPLSSLRSNVVIQVAPQGTARNCWMRLRPGAQQHAASLIRTQFVGYKVNWEQFYTPEQRPVETWESFAGLRLWWLGGAAVGLIAGVLTWTRNKESVVYLTFGTSRWMVAVLYGCEYLMVTTLAAPAGLLLTEAIGALTGADLRWSVQWLMVRVWWATLASAVAATFVMTALVLPRKVFVGLKE